MGLARQDVCVAGGTPLRLWSVFALRYATHHRMSHENFLHVDVHDVPMPIDFFVWALQSNGETIVVDTGFNAASGARRGRTLLTPVDAALARLNVAAVSVRDVVVTHLHYDHAGNLDLFPNARFHLQDREMSFATGRHMCFSCMRGAFEVDDVISMLRAVYAERVVFHDGDAALAEGVSLHRVGGHTDGLQMVRVETARGPVVLTSDACHYYANMERANPFPILFNLGDLTQGWRTARRLAGADERVVVGHDPIVRDIYPAVEGSGGEIVALHLPPRAPAGASQTA